MIIQKRPDMTSVPEDFAPHFRKSPVTAAWEPLYSRKNERSIDIGLLIAAAHCNSRGFVHGGVVAALADNAMGLSWHQARLASSAPADVGGGLVTVTLSVDFIASGQVGQWLQITPRVLRETGGTGFVDALVTADGRLIARSNAVFRALT
jgi:acyl-coenzyme A thioesterase PaaI-like protein